MNKNKPISGRLVIDYPFDEKKIYRCIQSIGGLVPGELVKITAQNFRLPRKDEMGGSGFSIVATRVTKPRTKVKFGITTRQMAQQFFESVI